MTMPTNLGKQTHYGDVAGRTSWRVVFFVICASVTCCVWMISGVASVHGVQGAEGDDSATTRPVRKAWERIKSARPDLAAKRGDVEYWLPIYDSAADEFSMLSQGDRRLERISGFVEKFGKDGAESDFRWMLASLHRTIPKNGAYSPLERNFAGDPVEGADFAEETLAFCEAQVKLLVEDPKLRERYYRFILWSGMYFGKGDVDTATGVRYGYVKGRLAKDRRPKDYWYLARDVVLLTHALGRSDLLTNADCRKMAEQFDRLDKWVNDNEQYFVVNKISHTWAVDGDAKMKGIPLRGRNDWPVLTPPNEPFPDWKGDSPPKEMLGKLRAAM